MKIAVSGKGGVGKTTVSATLAHLYAQESRKVIAADVDPDANLGLALGFPEEVLDEIVPISTMRKMISERTNASPDRTFYKLNPKVNDLVDLYGREHNGVRLIALGTVETAGGGCVCPENTMLRMLLMDLVLAKKDVVILDMEAGLEHLGRGTASGMDQFVVVIEPGARSVQTYKNVKRLAQQLGIPRIGVVANKVRNEADEAFIRSQIPESELLGIIHFNEDTSLVRHLAMREFRTGSAAFALTGSILLGSEPKIRYNKLRKFQNRRIENSPQNKGQGQRHLVE